MRIAITTVVLFLASFSANAAAGWTSYGVISELGQNHGTGSQALQAFVRVSVTGNPSSCDPTYFYFTPETDARRARMYATLLAAKAQGTRVMLYVTGTCNSSGPNGGASQIDAVWME